MALNPNEVSIRFNKQKTSWKVSDVKNSQSNLSGLNSIVKHQPTKVDTVTNNKIVSNHDSKSSRKSIKTVTIIDRDADVRADLSDLKGTKSRYLGANLKAVSKSKPSAPPTVDTEGGKSKSNGASKVRNISASEEGKPTSDAQLVKNNIIGGTQPPIERKTKNIILSNKNVDKTAEDVRKKFNASAAVKATTLSTTKIHNGAIVNLAKDGKNASNKIQVKSVPCDIDMNDTNVLVTILPVSNVTSAFPDYLITNQGNNNNDNNYNNNKIPKIDPSITNFEDQNSIQPALNKKRDDTITSSTARPPRKATKTAPTPTKPIITARTLTISKYDIKPSTGGKERLSTVNLTVNHNSSKTITTSKGQNAVTSVVSSQPSAASSKGQNAVTSVVSSQPSAASGGDPANKDTSITNRSGAITLSSASITRSTPGTKLTTAGGITTTTRPPSGTKPLTAGVSSRPPSGTRSSTASLTTSTTRPPSGTKPLTAGVSSRPPSGTRSSTASLTTSTTRRPPSGTKPNTAGVSTRPPSGTRSSTASLITSTTRRPPSGTKPNTADGTTSVRPLSIARPPPPSLTTSTKRSIGRPPRSSKEGPANSSTVSTNSFGNSSSRLLPTNSSSKSTGVGGVGSMNGIALSPASSNNSTRKSINSLSSSSRSHKTSTRIPSSVYLTTTSTPPLMTTPRSSGGNTNSINMKNGITTASIPCGDVTSPSNTTSTSNATRTTTTSPSSYYPSLVERIFTYYDKLTSIVSRLIMYRKSSAMLVKVLTENHIPYLKAFFQNKSIEYTEKFRDELTSIYQYLENAINLSKRFVPKDALLHRLSDGVTKLLNSPAIREEFNRILKGIKDNIDSIRIKEWEEKVAYQFAGPINDNDSYY